MTNCKSAELKNRTIIKITGADAKTFLTGLLTNDINDEGPMEVEGASRATFAGLLTPQGKILFDFPMAESNGSYYLDIDATVADDLIKRLTFYKMRADVEITSLRDSHRSFAIWDGDAAPAISGIFFTDPRLAELGWRSITDADNAIFNDCENASEEDYHAHRIRLGVPEGGTDYAYGDTFPHEACYDLLGGVDFKKGCFVGQEVVSRMQHRGTARKRILQVSSTETLPAGGVDITADEKPIGTLGSTSNGKGIALIRLDRAARALKNDHQIKARNIPLSLEIPGWANYKIE